MGDLFGGLRSGIQFPQVVMNQGPLPGAGGLPQPLHEKPDSRINYGSSLLGDLTPYAYAEPGYLSSQNAYLNIPHKIQKIVPKVFLPEAKVGAKDFFDLSHPVDDGDLAFVLRLDRSSLFCTGLKNGDMRRAGLGTAVDPLINLCTFNYILSGLQLGVTGATGDLWTEFFFNLDKQRFGKAAGLDSRDYADNPIGLDDVIHVVRNCVRPFGITRGSEKQGGQNEGSLSAANWPVSFIVSLTIDGKESNVLNIWHYHDVHAGDDLVLRLKLMPVRPYTLNHYYKSVKRQTWDLSSSSSDGKQHPGYVWQLVPDVFNLEAPKAKEVEEITRIHASLPKNTTLMRGERASALLRMKTVVNSRRHHNFLQVNSVSVPPELDWQSLGFWHIGRSQVMTGRYGTDEYWHNDMANTLRTNHLDITLQPMFTRAPFIVQAIGAAQIVGRLGNRLGETLSSPQESKQWSAELGLEKMFSAADRRWESRQEWPRANKVARTLGRSSAADPLPTSQGEDSSSIPVPGLNDQPVVAPAVDRQHEEPEWMRADSGVQPPPPPLAPAGMTLLTGAGGEPEWLGSLEYTDDPAPAAVASPPGKKTAPATATAAATTMSSGATKAVRRGRAMVGGSLLKADGTSEPSTVGML